MREIINLKYPIDICFICGKLGVAFNKLNK